MIDLKIPPGDQGDLECAVEEELVRRARATPNCFVKETWGEWRVLQGTSLHGVQWSYVGKDVYNDDGELIGISFDDDAPDCEVSCSWLEEENYEQHPSE